MKTLFAALFLMTATATFAADTIMISNAWIRLPPPGSTTSALFFDVKNYEVADRHLLKVTSPISDNLELHEMAMDGGKMSMRKVDKIIIKGGGKTSLRPGGMHVMIFNVKHPLKENEAVDVKLELDHKMTLSIKPLVQKDP